MDPAGAVVDYGQLAKGGGDEDLCRVCRSGVEEGPLFHPCRCIGSIRFVHEECLKEWLAVSKKARCELCSTPLLFTKIYDTTMPEKLPLPVLARHFVRSIIRTILLCLRAVVVAFAWLAILPYTSFWTFRFYMWSADGVGGFARFMSGRTTMLQQVGKEVGTTLVGASNSSTGEAVAHVVAEMVDMRTGVATFITEKTVKLSQLVGTTPNPYGNLTALASWSKPTLAQEPWRIMLNAMARDVFKGQIITSCVVVLFVCGFLLREWIMMNAPFVPPPPPPPPLDIVLGGRAIRLGGNQPDPNFDEQRAEIEALIAELRAPGQAFPALGLALNVVEEGGAPVEEAGEDAAVQVKQEEDEEDPWGGIKDGEDAVRTDWEDEDEDGGPPVASTSRGAFNATYAAERARDTRVDVWKDEEEEEAIEEPYDRLTEVARKRRADRKRRDERARRRATRRASGEPTPTSPPKGVTDRRVRPLPTRASPGASSSSDSGRSKGKQRADEVDEDYIHQHFSPTPEEPPARSTPDVPQNVVPEEPLPNPEFVPPPPPVQHLPVPNQQALPEVAQLADDPFIDDVVDDLEGVLEAIGFRGSLFVLIQNMGLMTLLVGLCLGGILWVPLCLGRALAAANAIRLVSLPLRAVRSISDPIFDALFNIVIFLPLLMFAHLAPLIAPSCNSLPQAISNLCTSLFPSPTALTDVASSVADATPSLPAATAGIVKASPVALTFLKRAFLSISSNWERMAYADDALTRALCVVFGYASVAFAGAIYLQTTRNAYSQSVNRAIREGIAQQLVLLKVCLFIFIEIILFPTTCGLIINLTTLPAFPDATIASRIAFFARTPVSALFLTWLSGTTFMFSFSVGIDTVREVVRDGTMWFIRDPQSADFHPVREILERDSSAQFRKIAISGLLYAGVIFATVGVNVLFLRYAVSDVLPLRWVYGRSFTSLPLDLLIFRFIIPPTIHLTNPRTHLRNLFVGAAKIAAHHLRLTSFIFGGRDPLEEGTHVRRTWRALLALKKADIDEREENGEMDRMTERAVVFRKDGGWARVPAIDTVRVAPGRRMIVPVTEAGDALDHEGVVIIEDQLFEMATTRLTDKYSVVYLPPAFKTRVALFIYLLWFTGSLAGMAGLVVPLLVGRQVFSLITPSQVHDLYSLTLGLYLVGTTAFLVHSLPSLRFFRPRLFHLRAVFLALSTTLSTIVLLPILTSLLFTSYLLLPLFPSLSSASPLPTLNLPQEWATGTMLLATFYHLFYPRLPAHNSYRHALDRALATWETGSKVDALAVLHYDVALPLILRLAVIVAFPGSVAACAWQAGAGSGGMPFVGVCRVVYGAAAGMVFGTLVERKVRKLVGRWVGGLREKEYLLERRLRNWEGGVAAGVVVE